MKKFKYILLLLVLFTSSFTTFMLLDTYYKNSSKATNSYINNSTTEYYVFLGDSITAGFNLNKYYNNSYYINEGVKNDTISKVMERLQNVINRSPKKIFLMIGINDLSSQSGVNDTIKENYKNLVESIINRSNETEIYLESILPVSNERYEGLNEDIIELNNYIKELAKKNNLTYIDLWSKFYDGEDLNSKLSNDGLHPNEEGYNILEAELKSYL